MVFKKGQATWNKGKKMNEETKIKMINSKKGKYGYIGKNNCEICNKEIIVYTTKQKFCKDCLKTHKNEYNKKYLRNIENKNNHKKTIKNWIINNQDKHRKYNKKYKEQNPLIIDAQRIAKQIILKPICGICNSTENLEKHHWRYDKPLLVNTLCRECHNIQHIKHFNKSCFGRD